MSHRPFAASIIFAGFICSGLVFVGGCNKQEAVQNNTVQHGSAWQRQAGQSPQAAASIALQSEKNTDALKKALQSGKAEDLDSMNGKLVMMDGELADQSDSTWTLKKDGWTIVAQVSDLTGKAKIAKSQVASCGAQGIIQKIDTTNKQIVLADVELAPEMKNPMSANVATK